MTPYAPPMPHHTDADRAIREAAALRRRLVEGAWRDDAARRQADFFAEEVRDMLPAPVLSRNAALQVWGKQTGWGQPIWRCASRRFGL